MKNTLNITFVLFFWIVFSSCESTGIDNFKYAVDHRLSDKIDAYINAWVANDRFNGNLLISQGDSLLYYKSFGLANREFGLQNSDSTKFLIGSITKPFTAYGILLLEHQGKLALDDRLSKYFPDFPNANNISIKQLLTHRSGITDYHEFKGWKADSKLDVSPQSTLASILTRPSVFEPGERFRYSNSGYIFLGLIIEQVTGLTYGQFIQSKIVEPLGLSSTGIASNTDVIANLASGYRTTPREVNKAEYINYAQPYASGNMYSTPADLCKFTQAVIHNKLLPPHKTKEIFNSEEYYGYGWGIRNFDGTKAYGHYGAMNGFVGSVTYIPESEIFICFLTNDDSTPEYTITEDLVHITSGKEVALPKNINHIPLTESMKSKVIGNYLIKERDTLKVFGEDNKLFMQETGQIKHELFPLDSLEYESVLFEFNVVFSEPKHTYSDTLKFTGKSKVMAKRIAMPNKTHKQ